MIFSGNDGSSGLQGGWFANNALKRPILIIYAKNIRGPGLRERAASFTLSMFLTVACSFRREQMTLRRFLEKCDGARVGKQVCVLPSSSS